MYVPDEFSKDKVLIHLEPQPTDKDHGPAESKVVDIREDSLQDFRDGQWTRRNRYLDEFRRGGDGLLLVRGLFLFQE